MLNNLSICIKLYLFLQYIQIVTFHIHKYKGKLKEKTFKFSSSCKIIMPNGRSNILKIITLIINQVFSNFFQVT